MSIAIQFAETTGQLQQILALQASNLRLTLPAETEEVEGFVTVRHTLPILQMMNELTPHTIAFVEEKVVGYALAMPPVFRLQIPELSAMFELLDKVEWHGKYLCDYIYLVMGQICIDRQWRRKGIFRSLYNQFFQTHSVGFDLVITEVATRNTRSLNAHLALGFVRAHIYLEEGVEEWVVLVYDFQKSLYISDSTDAK